jgi:ATP-dependent Clp protease ATP-binding subunit ClpB
MTSNLGSGALLSEGRNDDVVSSRARESVMSAVRQAFAPEFINRIDEMVIFNRLSRSALRQIVDVRLGEVEERVKDRRIKLDVDMEARDWLGERGYDPNYGARPLNRLIQKALLNPLARLLIDGGIRTGETARVKTETLENGETTLTIQRNHEPGSVENGNGEIVTDAAPVGEEEELLEDEYLKKKKEEDDDLPGGSSSL